MDNTTDRLDEDARARFTDEGGPIMVHDNQTQTGNGFVVGMLCGVAVGAALGLLFAPSNGKELRGKVGEGARWLGDQSKDMYDSARRTVNEAVASGRSAFEKARQTVGPNA